MNNSEYSSSKLEIKKLINKAEKGRQAHFMIAYSLGIWAKLLHGVILIVSSIVAILTFADINAFVFVMPQMSADEFRLIVGILASIVFILAVLEEYASLKEKSKYHEDAGKKLTTFIRDSDALLQQTEPINKEQNHIVRTIYQNINETSPIIPDRIFLKAKRKFLIKVEISKSLDSNPHKSFRKIRKELKNKVVSS